MDATTWSRFQFGLTITYHYLFPQLTMGLALIIVIFKALALRSRDPIWDDVARFWARIFGLNFAVGVVTGVPMEFQFGTNWARFSHYSGGVIGITLAMEGMFAFFAESAFLGLFLFGERRLSRGAHFFTTVMMFVGSWLSGFFIIVTNSFMQHPIGHAVRPDGSLQLVDVWGYLFNRWALWEYAHTMCAAVVTGAFVVAAIGAYWALLGVHGEHARRCLRVGVIAGLAASLLQLFPTGDHQGKLVAQYQRPALAAMEGKFQSGQRADLVLIGQPDVAREQLDNPITVPYVLSYLAYGSFGADVEGLEHFPRSDWPDNIELLYYSYHVMAGLGTLMILVMLIAAVLLRRDRVLRARWMLWILMLAFPFPYIATTTGWMTAELGRQPWVVYQLLRTAQGTSPTVSGGSVAFTTLGWLGIYFVVGVLFLYLVARMIGRGPVPGEAH